MKCRLYFTVSYSSSVYMSQYKLHAVLCTLFLWRPLPFFQVLLQTQQETKMRLNGMTVQVVRKNGIVALYNGLTASMSRQVCAWRSCNNGLIPIPQAPFHSEGHSICHITKLFGGGCNTLANSLYTGIGVQWCRKIPGWVNGYVVNSRLMNSPLPTIFLIFKSVVINSPCTSWRELTVLGVVIILHVSMDNGVLRWSE